MRTFPIPTLAFLLASHLLWAQEPGGVTQSIDQPSIPSYLESFAAPLSGARITRIAGEAGSPVQDMDILWSRPARHIYSSVAAWDSSDALLAIRNAGATKSDGSGAPEWLLLDGQTFEPVSTILPRFVEFRWWNTRPKRMLLITAEGLVDYDPVAQESLPIASAKGIFDRYREVGLNSQGNLSNDDRLIVLSGKHRDTGSLHVIVFSLHQGKLIAERPLNVPRLDYATISPKGTYVVVNGELIPGQPDQTRVLDLDGVQAGEDWGPYGTPSHYDLTIDEGGKEIAVGVAKTALPGIAAGSVIARELETGKIRLLRSGGYAMHTSCRNLKLPGWAFVSYSTAAEDTAPATSSSELVAIKVDGSGESVRICKFRQRSGDYWAQPQACPNTQGSLAVFGTNWPQPDAGAEAMVVEIGLLMQSAP